MSAQKAYIKTPRIFDIKKKITADSDKIKKALIDLMCYVGEQCVSEARGYGNYNDITGNLRSSIGYVVLHNGQPVRYGSAEQFSGSGTAETDGKKEQANNGAEGVKQMRKLIRKLAGDLANIQGIVLVVAAGMNYAIYVEAKGKNVLTSSKLLAQELVPELLRQLGFKK